MSGRHRSSSWWRARGEHPTLSLAYLVFLVPPLLLHNEAGEVALQGVELGGRRVAGAGEGGGRGGGGGGGGGAGWGGGGGGGGGGCFGGGGGGGSSPRPGRRG